MNRDHIGRHEARPQLVTDRELVKTRAAARVGVQYDGRHRS